MQQRSLCRSPAVTAETNQAWPPRSRRRWLAVLEQRTRFARELHGVVAHHMSPMAIRAESAPHQLGALRIRCAQSSDP